MANALHLAPRLFLVMLFPLGLMFIGVFLAAVTSERRRRNKAVRAMLGEFETAHHKPVHKAVTHRSRYAYALEQQQLERFNHFPAIRFRSSHTGLSGKH